MNPDLNQARIELQSEELKKYVSDLDNPRTNETIRKRLIRFEKFVLDEYKTIVDSNFILNRLEQDKRLISDGKIDLFDFFDRFGEYLRKHNPIISGQSIEGYYLAARKALIKNGLLINQEAFKLRVKKYKKTNNIKTQITKKDVINLLRKINNNIRLKTFILLLVSSGIRSGEACQLKYKDLQLDMNPPRIILRSEIAKTGIERYVILTSEMVEQFKEYFEYKYRYRKPQYRNRNGENIKVIFKKPDNIHESYIFKVRDDEDLNGYFGLYRDFRIDFSSIVKKLNLGRYYKNKRYSVSLHSLRWFVKTIVQRATSDDQIAHYWIGHKTETYQWEPSEEQLKLAYNKIESELTFMNENIIEQLGEAQQAQIDNLKEKLELETKKHRKEILITKLQNVINRELEKKHNNMRFDSLMGKIKYDDNLVEISLSPEEQYEVFINSAEAHNLSEEDLKTIKELITDSVGFHATPMKPMNSIEMK